MPASRRVRRELGAVVPAARTFAVPPTREALLRLSDDSGNDNGFLVDNQNDSSPSSSSYRSMRTTITSTTSESSGPETQTIVLQRLCARLEHIAERNRALHMRCFTRAVARRLQAETPLAETDTLACAAGAPDARPW